MSNKMLEQNVKTVKRNIAASAGEKDVVLVAVSKTVPAETMNAAADLGITFFGENYAQELCDKYDSLDKSKIKLHFIGHLQRNKVKYVVGKVEMIQSVDSFELAKEIDKQSAKIGRVTDILIQINIGDEAQKGGVAEDEAEELILRVSELKNTNVRGIMAIPPCDGVPEPYFKKMKSLFDDLKQKYNLDILSMGMTADYKSAIRCGANMVRIGTGIFGARNYSKG